MATSTSRDEQSVRHPSSEPAHSSNQNLIVYRQQGNRANVSWLAKIGLAALSIVSGVYLSSGNSIDPIDYQTRTKDVLSKVPLIDGHNDLPYLIRSELKHQIYNDRFTFNTGLLSQTDRKKLRDGMVGGQFWSAYIHCPDPAIETDLEDPTWVVRDTLEQIDITRRFVDQYPDLFQFCDNSTCAIDAFRNGRIGSYIGIEGGHQLGNSLGALRMFYDLGARYITTTHNCDNVFATAASTVAAGGKDVGLTEFGLEYVKEMNRLGMMIDLSHVSHQTMRDILDVSEGPVIFSHSGAHGLSKSLRFAPDDVIRKTAEKGGIVMITFVTRFLRPDDPSAATIHDVVDHIWYVADLVGWDYVGVGGDFDGTPVTPVGLEDVSKYPRLVELLMERGATDRQIRKFAGENILRVWREVEEVARTIQSKGGKPNEATWSGRKWVRDNKNDPRMFRDSIGRRIPTFSGDP